MPTPAAVAPGSAPRRVLAAVAPLAAAAALATAAVGAQPPERATPLVSVDFAAFAPDGSPVADLSPRDVQVRVAGRVRPLRALQLVRVDDQRPPSVAGAPPFATNDVSDDGRLVALVVEDESLRPGREGPLRAAVDRLVAGLAPRDRVALAILPYGGVRVAPTTDHQRVRVAVAQLTGRGASDESGSAMACRTRRTLEALTGYLETLGARESPAVVVFATGGLAAPRRDAPVMKAPGMCELLTDTFEQVAAAAALPRAQFYIVLPDHIMARGAGFTENIAGVGYLGSDNPMEGLEHLAGVTGGAPLPLSGDDTLLRVLRESAAYYRASFDGDRADRGRRPQALEVRVSRPGVSVRSRGRVAFADPAAAALPANPSPRDLIRVASVFRDLPLRASAYPAPEADGSGLRIVALAEPVESGVTLSSLVAALFDRDGTLVANWVARPEDLARTPVMGAMLAGPGAYRLRVAAIDATGRSGTADYEVDAELARSGPLRISAVVLGLSREGGFVPRLQFGGEAVAIGYLEMHGAEPGAAVTAVLELAETPNGPALLQTPLAIRSGGERHYLATGALPIGALAPGDYTVRAIVGLQGHPPTRVLRTLRKTGSHR